MKKTTQHKSPASMDTKYGRDQGLHPTPSPQSERSCAFSFFFFLSFSFFFFFFFFLSPSFVLAPRMSNFGGEELYDAVSSGRASEVSSLLWDHPEIDVNWTNAFRRTPLHCACMNNRVKVVTPKHQCQLEGRG